MRKIQDEEVLAYIQKNGRATFKMIMEQFNITPKTTNRILKRLILDGKIRKIGKGLYEPNGHGEIDVMELMSNTHKKILKAFEERDILSTPEIIDKIGIKKFLLSDCLRELTMMGLVKRIQRGVYQITEKGREILKKIKNQESLNQ